jgi:glycosyltransferase involved in cell wall biosynthesis
MRIGVNPEKDKKIASDAYHRIIIPVYIPHLNDYFEHGLEFTSLCIESVIKTKHSRSALSVVNNGSCEEVTNYLQQLYNQGKIDQLVHYKQNAGKIDAMMQIAKTASEPLITLSDGDVLFTDGWIQATEKVFSVFPEAGMVSPVPHGTMYAHFTANTIYDGIFKGRLKFQSVCDPEDMLRFAESIGSSDTMYKKSVRLKYQLTVNRKELSAVVGCGHFVATMRREVFNYSPGDKSNLAYASEADKDYIDVPNEKAGLWRLATTGNYAYHMGNIPQDWMRKKFKELTGEQDVVTEIPQPKMGFLPMSFKRFVVNRLWLNRIVKPHFFRRLGLKEGNREY